MTNADAGACVAYRGSIVGSAWEQPRYPMHASGDIGVDDGVSRGVMLLPDELVMLIAVSYCDATEMC